MKPYEQCDIAKAKKKNVNKDVYAKKAEHPNERWSHNIATINRRPVKVAYMRPFYFKRFF